MGLERKWAEIRGKFERCLGLNQSSTSCNRDSFRPAQNVEFCEKVSQMALHREFTYEKTRADFPVAFSSGKQLKNFDFAFR
jgi:hypothetical protein